MKVELHLHTSRYSACALDSPEQMLAAASDKGYDAVFLTEHDTVWPKDRLDGLARNFPDLLILPGLERTIRDQHLLILGTSDEAWLSMTRLGPIFARARKADCLTILAHPFRWAGGADMLYADLGLPDAIEQCTGNQQGRASQQAAEEAATLSLPTVFASDAHSTAMLGQFWIETQRDFQTGGQLREIILTGQYTNCSARSA